MEKGFLASEDKLIQQEEKANLDYENTCGSFPQVQIPKIPLIPQTLIADVSFMKLDNKHSCWYCWLCHCLTAMVGVSETCSADLKEQLHGGLVIYGQPGGASEVGVRVLITT